MEAVSAALLGASKRRIDVSSEFPWPNKLDPVSCHLYTYNELDIVGDHVTADEVFATLTNLSLWPKVYEHASNISLSDGSEGEPAIGIPVDSNDSKTTFTHQQQEGGDIVLKLGTTFTFTSFLLPVVATVKEYIPGKRLAWEFVAVKNRAIRGYRTWTILPLSSTGGSSSNNGVRLITEETQKGLVSLVGRFAVHPTLTSAYQGWLEGIKKYCGGEEEQKEELAAK